MNYLKFFIGFKKGIKNFGQDITLIINTALLSFVYILGVGITSLIAKLFKKHFLEMGLSKKSTYWSDLNLKKKRIEDYYKRF